MSDGLDDDESTLPTTTTSTTVPPTTTTTTTTTTPVPDLTPSITGPDTLIPGLRGRYTFSISNVGDAPTTGTMTFTLTFTIRIQAQPQSPPILLSQAAGRISVRAGTKSVTNPTPASSLTPAQHQPGDFIISWGSDNALVPS